MLPAPPPHPNLKQPKLFVSGLDPSLSDKDIVGSVFEKYLPVRLRLDRESAEAQGTPASGTVEFQSLTSAEKALATIRGGVRLSTSEQAEDPVSGSKSKPRLIKQLPPGTEDVDVYDLFRPYGPLVRANRILTNPAGQHTGFRGMALVEYFEEEHAQAAQNELHCTDYQGKTISVAIDNVARRPSAANQHAFSPSAAVFVPGGGGSFNASAPAFRPPGHTNNGSGSSIYASQPAPPQLNQQQVGPIIPVPGTNLQYSASAATYIDPCNLFCKNLDPEIDSNDLFNAFKSFGKIVSARVMRDDSGVSREFGFVSYTNADDASRALHAMNNTQMGAKQMSVRLHEPKRMREQKLAAKFGGASADSPPISAGGAASETNGSPSGTPQVEHAAAVKNANKRQSNSYFKAAMENSGTTLDHGELAAMSPAVRNEVVAGEFTRRVKELPTVKPSQVQDIVLELLKLKLSEQVEALNNPIELIQRVSDARDVLPPSPVQSKSAQPSGLLGVPINPSGSLAGTDGASFVSTAPASAKERERLLRAVTNSVPSGSPVEDITDMLVSLNKKERALCLFNPEFLKQKVEEAKEILDISEADSDEGPAGSIASGAAAATTGGGKTRITSAALAAVSEAGVSSSEVAASAQTHTLASLARLPAIEIVRLATSPNSSGSAGLPLPKADASVSQSTNAFIDSLSSKSPQDQKQAVGEQLYKKVKSFGVKGAPKITITLLDSEDLRSLAHLMNSYPEVLREKVLLTPAK
ncbi:related to polyadenylate-binding protein 3 [Ceraceosorus bombacis]|uniref:Related to polyadenylate-binding protein 3 n=1 Tax=Ceraceosorus bombacis TaxID=401625 RepID=A0A0P1BRD0_9BASI|nr:related to polyadenylate-binding protein 3 [Ceraceosorus bombacis]